MGFWLVVKVGVVIFLQQGLNSSSINMFSPSNLVFHVSNPFIEFGEKGKSLMILEKYIPPHTT
jgi:hypothetical protein